MSDLIEKKAPEWKGNYLRTSAFKSVDDLVSRVSSRKQLISYLSKILAPNEGLHLGHISSPDTINADVSYGLTLSAAGQSGFIRFYISKPAQITSEYDLEPPILTSENISRYDSLAIYLNKTFSVEGIVKVINDALDSSGNFVERIVPKKVTAPAEEYAL